MPIIQANVAAGAGRRSGASAASPSSGPGASSTKSQSAPRKDAAELSNWMLRMVIEKPMQFAMVSAEPTSSRGAFAAFSAENWGESPTTKMPEDSKNARNSGVGAWNASGDSTQHRPDASSCAKATGALPQRSDSNPPATQPTRPAAMIANAHSGTLRAAACAALCAASTKGAKAQKAYSSHMWPKYPKAEARNRGARKITASAPGSNLALRTV